MKKIIFLLCFVSFFACQDDLPLGKPYDFIAGVLTPDSLRDFPNEIFVGKIFPHEDPPVQPLCENEILNLVVLAARSYFAIVIGKDDAKVFVEDENGKKVEFKNVGNGFYRDENNELKVEQLKKYKLEVLYDNKTYTGETIVPGNFEIKNEISEGDTIEIPRVEGDSGGIFYPEFTESKNAFLYRIAMQKSEDFFLGHSLKAEPGYSGFWFGALAPPVYETDLRISAIDSNCAAFYTPGNMYGGTADFHKWFKERDLIPITKRSTIKGGKNVAGCFGSYNQDKIEKFYVREKK